VIKSAGPLGDAMGQQPTTQKAVQGRLAYDQDKILPFWWVARDVPFPVCILDQNSFSRRKASHLSIARFKFYVAIQPYGEESIRWSMKPRLAHSRGKMLSRHGPDRQSNFLRP
jgi:hypothetical protein